MNKRLIWNFEINSGSPLILPATSSEHASMERWESRFFWPEQKIITLNGLDGSFLDLSRYQIKHKKDVYYLLPHSDFNLKVRRNQLLYKPILMRTAHAVAYGKKINLEEQEPTTRLPGEIDALTLLSQVQHQGLRIEVDKELLVYRFKTEPSLKLELARLNTGQRIWFSINIESRSKHLVDFVRHQLFSEQIACDYVTFLKNL